MKINNFIKKIKSKWKIITTLLLLIGLVVSFTIKSKANNEKPPIFTHPTVKSITKTLEVSGHVDAKQKARLRFIAGGKLVYLGAKEGDLVKKWQTIARIDKAALDKALKKNLNLYMKQRWNWEDTVDSIKDRPIDLTQRRSVDRNQWDLDNTVIDVEIQDIAIKNTALYAPFEGIVTKSPTMVAGVQLLATDYFEIVNPKSLIFRAAVDESDIANISKNQSAKLVLDSFPNEQIDTTVNYISYSSTETSSGTAFIVEFPLSETLDNNKLRIGMNGDINIVLETKNNVLTIPTIAITQKDSKNYVKVKIDNNKYQEKEIEIGLETDELTEVTKGLTQADEIVIPEQ